MVTERHRLACHRTASTVIITVAVVLLCGDLLPVVALLPGRCPSLALNASEPPPQQVAHNPPRFTTWRDGDHHTGLACRSLRSRRYPPLNATHHHPSHGALPPLPPTHLPRCYKLAFSTPVHGNFSLGPHGPLFHLATCRLRRLSADAALRCLAGLRVVWLGDSLTRYQATALAYWLGNGAHQHPYDEAVPQHLPSLTNEGAWPSWDAYYTAVTAELTEPGCMHASCAGCYRDDNTTHESFVWSYTLASNATFTMAARSIFGHPSLDTAALDALEWALNKSATKPDVLILNVGIWVANICPRSMPIAAILAIFTALFQRATALVASQAPPRTHLVFKSTTRFNPRLIYPGATRNTSTWLALWGEHVEPLVKTLALQWGFDYYDVASLAEAGLHLGLHAMWDPFHYYPYMYAQFNDLLLNVLC